MEGFTGEVPTGCEFFRLNLDGESIPGHIQPIAMFGGEMKLQFFENALGLFRRKSFIQRSRFMRAKIIQYHPDRDGIGIKNIDQPLHTISKINHGMSLSNKDISLSNQGFIKHV